MPAALRGTGRSKAGSRAKAPASPGRPRASAKRPQPAAKLRAVGIVGLPPSFAFGVAAAVLVVGLTVTLATGNRAQRLTDAMGSALAGETAGLGFRVDKVHLQGASPEAREAVLNATGLRRGEPILDVDLAAVRQSVERVGWVKHAQIVRLLPDTVVIAVEQRETLAVWQNHGRTWVIDGAGQPIPEADPGLYPQLPLVVGEGGNEALAQILPAVQSRPRLRDRLEALVRVDSRRWDLRLKDGGIIQLPAVEEESALIQLDQLDRRQRILELGFARIDLRQPGTVVVRPRETTVASETPEAAGV